MSVSLANNGELRLGELRSFADVINRQIERCDGNRSATERLTQISEQNLRRWGEQGQFPNIATLHEIRRQLPAEMWLDLICWMCEGTRVCAMLIEEVGHVLTSPRECSRELVDNAIAIERKIEDGGAGPAFISSVTLLTGEQSDIVKKLSMSLIDGATLRRRSEVRR